jgi:hypothetical protein
VMENEIFIGNKAARRRVFTTEAPRSRKNQ